MKDFIAYCGLDCETCEARLATVNHDEALRRRVAALWSELNHAEITPDMIRCTGCRIDGVKTPYCNSLCPIRQCALSRGVETCGSCGKTETCEKLASITKNNPDALRRLKAPRAVLYIHGKGGSPDEAAHYRPLFPDCHVIGFDYKAQTPWEAKAEFPAFFDALKEKYGSVTLIANSIGAYFAMSAGIDARIDRACFISPIVDMERLILDMLTWARATEADPREKGVIHTAFGEDLSWEYLTYVRAHPVTWHAKTEILYGAQDNLTSYETVSAFAQRHSAGLTVMEDGEHWFHTQAQMQFLDCWIRDCETR